MRVSLNGPFDISHFPSFKYAKAWTGLHSGDPRIQPGRKRANVDEPNVPLPKRIFASEVPELEVEEVDNQVLERAAAQRDLDFDDDVVEVESVFNDRAAGDEQGNYLAEPVLFG
jgi:hypothetical protein